MTKCGYQGSGLEVRERGDRRPNDPDMRKRIKLWAAAMSLAGLSTIAPAGPVFGQEQNIFTMTPAPGASTSPGNDYFLIQAKPGETVQQEVAIRNESSSPITVQLVAVDARTGPVGGVSYNLPEEPRVKVGSWVGLQNTEVTLSGGQSVTVPFSVAIPADAGPGDHLGGITAFIPQTEPAAAATGTGASIVVKTRRVVAVQVVLPGGRGPHLVIDGVEPAARADGLWMEILTTHDGHKLTRGTGFIELKSESFRKDFQLDTFVPATSIRYPIKWTSENRIGRFTGHVEIHYDGLVAVWDGSFEVGQQVAEELKDRQVEDSPGASAEKPSGSIPLTTGLAIGFGFGLVIAFLVFIIFRRRRKKEEEEDQKPEQLPPPAQPAPRPATKKASSPKAIRHAPKPRPKQTAGSRSSGRSTESRKRRETAKSG